MRSSRGVRASDCQCQSRSSPGFRSQHSPLPLPPLPGRSEFTLSWWGKEGGGRGRTFGKGGPWKSHKTHKIQYRLKNTVQNTEYTCGENRVHGLDDFDGDKSITRAIGRGAPWKSRRFWPPIAFALLTAISGPQKILIFRANPFQWAEKSHLYNDAVQYIYPSPFPATGTLHPLSYAVP